MKIQIRNGAWETNSSSMHSLLIMKKRQTMTQEEIRDEFWRLNEGDRTLKLNTCKRVFGRGFDILISFRDKLEYALASYLGSCYTLKNYIEAGDGFVETFEPMLKKLIGVDEIEMPMNAVSFNVYTDSIDEDDPEQDYNTYEEVPYQDLIWNKNRDDEFDDGRYKKVCKSGREQTQIWLEVPEFGEIDHQSASLLQGFLKKYGITLEEYLIRKDIIVVIDSDETCFFESMSDSGLIDKNAIQVRYPKDGSYDFELYKEEHPEKFDENGDWIDEETD